MWNLISLATCIFNVVDFASLQGAFCNFVTQVLPTSSLRIKWSWNVCCVWIDAVTVKRCCKGAWKLPANERISSCCPNCQPIHSCTVWVPALQPKSFKLPANSSLILCFAFCGLRSTSIESPVNLTHSCVLDFVNYIGRVSSCQPIRSCVLDFVNYIGRVSSCQPIHSSVFWLLRIAFVFQVSLNLFLCALDFLVCIFTHFVLGGNLFLWTRLCLNVSSS